MNLGEISSSFRKTLKNSAQGVNGICRDSAQPHCDVLQGKHTTHQSQHTPLSLYRRFLRPGAFGLAPLPGNCPPFACPAWSPDISVLALPVAPRPFCVCWDGVKWTANVPSALLGGGFAQGLELCCEGLAPAFDFLALPGVPSACLPVAFLGGGGALLGFTVLFLWLGGLLFLLYIPPSRTIYWKPIGKVFTHSVLLDWCHSVTAGHSSPQISNK